MRGVFVVRNVRDLIGLSQYMLLLHQVSAMLLRLSWKLLHPRRRLRPAMHLSGERKGIHLIGFGNACVVLAQVVIVLLEGMMLELPERSLLDRVMG